MQELTPLELAVQLKVVSAPVHWTLESQILPIPSPKLEAPLTASAPNNSIAFIQACMNR